MVDGISFSFRERPGLADLVQPTAAGHSPAKRLPARQLAASAGFTCKAAPTLVVTTIRGGGLGQARDSRRSCSLHPTPRRRRRRQGHLAGHQAEAAAATRGIAVAVIHDCGCSLVELCPVHRSRPSHARSSLRRRAPSLPPASQPPRRGDSRSQSALAPPTLRPFGARSCSLFSRRRTDRRRQAPAYRRWPSPPYLLAERSCRRAAPRRLIARRRSTRRRRWGSASGGAHRAAASGGPRLLRAHSCALRNRASSPRPFREPPRRSTAPPRRKRGVLPRRATLAS